MNIIVTHALGIQRSLIPGTPTSALKCGTAEQVPVGIGLGELKIPSRCVRNRLVNCFGTYVFGKCPAALEVTAFHRAS